ncbi:MOZART2 family [Ostreococcus tauri]|uniref:MOZART2 family n=1 Tax=Ostreococcus tauri TaxID=70448 RepID=A0A090N3S4_OSTTA|nr:MOZART2 family [Ostreococcus tauri]CEF98623.1 MOZART2 family [Ostreococcus tauri]|eukprot:XP_022839378.1 MOZART2 family [Ostreococcus tauri]
MATARAPTRAEVSEALRELASLAGVDVRADVHEAVLELCRRRVVPTATAQVLRSLASKAQGRARSARGDDGCVKDGCRRDR